MPRKYIRKLGGRAINTCDPDKMKKAVEAVRQENMTIRKAAVKFGVKKSTLADRVNEKHGNIQGGQTVIPVEIENIMVDRLLLCAEWGFPLTLLDLRLMCKGYLDRRGITVKKFKNNYPGIDWSKSFISRHKGQLSERLSQNIKLNRAAVGPDSVNAYFRNLQKEVIGVPPSNIVNYDETNLVDDPGRKKVIVRRGCRYPERVCNSSKAATSLMCAAAGDGTVLPCYVVYRAIHLYDTWTEGGPNKCRYNRSKSGWFDSVCFEDWFLSVVVPYMRRLSGKKIMIGDNLSSHMSLAVLEKCKEEGIAFVFLPPNSTHLTQPLDVAFFRPMKIYWRQVMDDWKRTPAGRKCSSIPKDIFPSLLNKLFDKLAVFQADNVKSGFRQTGIIPFSPDVVLSRLPKTSQPQSGPSGTGTGDVGTNTNSVATDTGSHSQSVDASLKQLLVDMRGMDDMTDKRRRAKRMKVEPGKSCSFNSNDESDDNGTTNSGTDSDSGSESGAGTGNSDSDASSTIDDTDNSDVEPSSGESQAPASTSTNTGTGIGRVPVPVTFTGVKRYTHLEVGMFLLVKLANEKSTKFYIAQVDKVYKKKPEVDVSYLKQYRTANDQFVKSDMKETFIISLSDIVGQVEPPRELRRGVMQFSVDSREWHV